MIPAVNQGKHGAVPSIRKHGAVPSIRKHGAVPRILSKAGLSFPVMFWMRLT